jgi:hypothetical protein
MPEVDCDLNISRALKHSTGGQLPEYDGVFEEKRFFTI